MRRLRILTLTILLIATASAQSRVGQWKSYTSFLNVRETIELDGKLVSVTSGGILIYDPVTTEFETLTNVDGLAETDLATLSIDVNGHLWLGSAAPLGIVQIYDLANRQSIKTFDFELSQITDIATLDSVVFVAYAQNLDWGILEFTNRDGNFIYRQILNPSVDRLGAIVGLTIRGDILYAGTDRGIFFGDFRKYILNYPQNWESVTRFEEKDVTVFSDLDEDMLVVANGEVWLYGDESKLLSAAYADTTLLLDVALTADGTLYGITRWKLVRFGADGTIAETWRTRARAQQLLPLSDGNVVVDSDHGFAVWRPDRERFEWLAHNSPISNVYTAMAVLDDGRLVAAGPEGISILNEDGWYNIISSKTKWAVYGYGPEAYNRFVADTVQLRMNRVWSLLEEREIITLSYQGVIPARNDFDQPVGGGVVIIDLNDPGGLMVYDTTGGRLEPFDERGYMNVRGLHHDSDGNLWIANFGAGDLDKKISVATSGGEWFNIPQLGGGILQTLDNPTDIVTPEKNVVLIGSSKDDGLFVLKLDQSSDGDGVPDALDSDDDNDDLPDAEDWDDDNDGIADQSDDLPVTWVNFSTNHGLDNNTIWSLISPEPEMVLVLTAQGLQRLTFSGDYTKVTPYFFTYFSGVPFGEGSKLVMDGRENIWVSSVTSGLYVLLANATPWPDWGGFRHDNSYLLSDAVTAVAIDDKRGLAFIATSKGINALRIPFAGKKQSYSKVKTFPSPFRIPSATPMVIDGLMDNSSLKIMTLSGKVLREIQSTSISVQGFQAFWDGKMNDGRYVGTGIYLVAIYAESGESKVTKIAVIRE